MTMGIKDVIARCIERMRGGACATCDNRNFCPAGRWQQAFGPPKAQRGDFFAFLGGMLQALAAPQTEARCFRKDVEQAVEPLLASGDVGIDRVARELGMSRQTLYRRLKAEGVTFEQILDAKRRQLAVRYLKLDRISVKAAAYKLGFSDPAAFSRAFKRWTGLPPSEARAEA
jgi:AraC-like DNA-binding protein